MPSIKILVVDDFEGFRRFVCSELQRNLDCQISEADDGLVALERAKQARQDLIILDIGLPVLNGIETGRRIRDASPNSRILYLSQEASVEVVREALQLGALGYVLKADAADELLLAVDAVLQGRQFVSRRLAAPGMGDAFRARPDRSLRSRDRLPVEQKQREIGCLHDVASYRNEAAFVEDFARFIETALRVGNPVILVASESHRHRLLKELERRGWDVAGAIREGSYTPLDASEMLAIFMENDWPDPTRLADLVGSVIEKASKAAKAKHSKVAVCGECAPTLLAEGKAEAAIEVEHLWDDLARRFGIQVLCGYVLTDYKVAESSQIFERICREHSSAYFL